MQRAALVVLVLIASGCVTLTPEGGRVSVYTAPLDAPPARRELPDGCQRVVALPGDWMSEREMEGQAHPFWRQRNAAAASGANVLLVLKEPRGARTDVECPNSSPITDCLGTSGAWFAVTFEGYMCTPQAIQILNTPAK
jgi:hypothetical protein